MSNYFVTGNLGSSATSGAYGLGAGGGGAVDSKKADEQAKMFTDLAHQSTGDLSAAYSALADAWTAVADVKTGGLTDVNRGKLWTAYKGLAKQSDGWNDDPKIPLRGDAYNYAALATAIKNKDTLPDVMSVATICAQAYGDLSNNWSKYTDLISGLKNINPSDVAGGKAAVAKALGDISALLGAIQGQIKSNPSGAGFFATQVKLLNSLYIDLLYRNGDIDRVQPDAWLSSIKDMACNPNYGVTGYTLDSGGKPVLSVPFAGYDSFLGPKDDQGKFPIMFVGRDVTGKICDCQFKLQFASGPGGLFLAKDGSGYKLVDKDGNPVKVSLGDGSVVERLNQVCWPIKIGAGDSWWDVFSSQDSHNLEVNSYVKDVLEMLYPS